MFFNKVETVGSVKDFLGESPTKKVIAGSLVGLGVGAVATLLKPAPLAVPAMAMPLPILGSVGIADRIIKACDPIIQLIQGVSYPVGFIMLCAGFLVIMTGNRQKGLNMIKWAIIGYLGMQLAPALMSLAVEVGKAMMH